jgi:hypothetical protein
MGDPRSTGYSGAVQIKCCTTDGKTRYLHFLPVIPTCVRNLKEGPWTSNTAVAAFCKL